MSQLTMVLLLLHVFSVEISWLSFNQNVQLTNDVSTSSSLLNAKWTPPFCLLSKIPATSPGLFFLGLGVCGDGDLSGCLYPDPPCWWSCTALSQTGQCSHLSSCHCFAVRKWAAVLTVFLEASNTPLKKSWVQTSFTFHFTHYIALSLRAGLGSFSQDCHKVKTLKLCGFFLWNTVGTLHLNLCSAFWQ